jgi:hypothetical protein
MKSRPSDGIPAGGGGEREPRGLRRTAVLRVACDTSSTACLPHPHSRNADAKGSSPVKRRANEFMKLQRRFITLLVKSGRPVSIRDNRCGVVLRTPKSNLMAAI